MRYWHLVSGFIGFVAIKIVKVIAVCEARAIRR